MVIELPMVERLEKLSKSQNVTLLVTLLSAFTVLLSRYSRQNDIVIGTFASGRDLSGWQALIGPLENALVIRTDTSGDPSFLELLRRVNESTGEMYAHQNVPFELLVEELHVERDMSRNPLFQIMFSLEQDLGKNDRRMHRLTASRFKVPAGLERFDLSVRLLATTDGLEVTFSYNTDLFDPPTIVRMLGHFRVMLESVADNPEQKIAVLPVLTEAERQQLLVEWNNTSVDYPRNIPLHRFIEEQVERTPATTALIYESEQLSYRELNSRANQLAHRLRKLGVGPDDLVSVCADRSVEMVLGLLGILKAGGAYVPLDPEYPQERLQTMQQDANSRILLTQKHLLDRIPKGTNHVICLDRDWATIQEESPNNLSATVSGNNLAYAIYTSGSTGKPKGVPNVHQGVVNRLLWMQDMYKLTAADRVLQKTPFSFDVSVWEFFWPLMAGATLVLARPGGHKDPKYLVNLIAGQKITTLHFVPSMLSIFLEVGSLERCRTLKRVFVSGEALPFELQERFFERLPSELHNLYGPTEAAVDVTYWTCQRQSKLKIVPIGRPIANIQIYILDASLQPVPIGVSGELHIGGIGLARGYLNQPELTALKFIPDPFDRQPGARLYKTGDLARFLPDGNIEYLGRVDHQVKLRGFRIELSEIEAVLTEYAGVRQAAVTVREDTPGDKRLVAYLVPFAEEGLQIDQVRDRLKEKLPEFMVPSRFVTLQKFPMTTSGKIDRRALPVPLPESPDAAPVIAPRNSLETDLASIFQSILGVDSVGIMDDFFDLGGHSLLAARLVSRVGTMMGFEVPLSALFHSPTVESLARLLRERSVGGPDPVAMQIQVGEGSLPFFAIVPPGEEALGYAILARHMGRHQAVYKVQAHAPVVANRPYTEQEMRAMSQEYVAAILAVQSEGPYCLGGMCDGTHIAERITLDLEAQHQEVGLLAIFDTWPIQNTQNRWLWRLNYYQQRVQQLRIHDLATLFEVGKRALANQIGILTGKVQARNEWAKVYWQKDFVPKRFRAPVALFKRPRQPFYYVNDPEMRWGVRSEGGVEIHQIPFDHDELLREPHVRTLGEQLAACIERVGQRRPSPYIARKVRAYQAR